MKNEQILKKAIEKAQKNGWKNQYDTWAEDVLNGLIEEEFYYRIIFSHEFAKTIWGENAIVHYFDKHKEKIKVDSGYPFNQDDYWWTIEAWQYHLQQMVVSEEPLKYIEKFL